MDIREVDVKALAYIGDAIYELYVREYVVNNFRVQVNKLHKTTIKYVSARAQAYIMESLNDELTTEEKDIFRRGRNAEANTVPKNTDVVTYKIATGFESLMGYLYMTADMERLKYLISKSIEIIRR